MGAAGGSRSRSGHGDDRKRGRPRPPAGGRKSGRAEKGPACDRNLGGPRAPFWNVTNIMAAGREHATRPARYAVRNA
ncbi:hypothetical protein SAMN04489764_4287 [Thermostaphylospora chromogena]|uniref:Uncharacterized protein n=1 Tax=Thermostaphylospora chromogena TaxID=35622 RepID=A0A1H1HCI7_9ACTN|nr:hypothetical protein SAMN04489764_4287 [Thermostaphylospora chromogena]